MAHSLTELHCGYLEVHRKYIWAHHDYQFLMLKIVEIIHMNILGVGATCK